MANQQDGQVVLVTGAGGGLGQGVVRAFAAAGATVAALDLNVEAVSAESDAQAVDLLDSIAVESAVARLHKRHGRIDALINAVGGFTMGPPVHETPQDSWEKMLDLNVRTVLNAVRAVVPVMQQAGRGRIVNVGAVAAHAGLAQLGAYIGSKSMLMRLTESMAEELKGEGINVNAVLPSVIDTPVNRQAMPDADFAGWVRPEQLAAVMQFLCSDAAAAVHGALIPVRGLS